MLYPSDFIFNENTVTNGSLSFMESFTPIKYHVPYQNSKEPAELTVRICTFDDVQTIVNTSIQSYHDFYTKSVGSSSIDSCDQDVLIPGVRHMSPGLIVFERPPSYQVVSVDMDQRDNIDDNTSQTEYYLPIPWQVYIAAYNPSDMRLMSVKMFFTSTSLFSNDQPLYAPPIFNFYSNGNLCRPFFSNMEDIEKYPKTISGVIASAYDWIWNSGFNYDITENISQFLYSKKYEQFYPYVKDTEACKYYDWLVGNPISGIPRTLPNSHLKAFFLSWQEIPLGQVSSIIWSTYTQTDFFFQEYSDQNRSFLDEYILQNDIPHHVCDEDCEQNEDEDEDNSFCDYQTTSEYIMNTNEYILYLRDRLANHSKGLRPAIKDSVNFLSSNKITQRKLSANEHRSKYFSNASLIVSQSS